MDASTFQTHMSTLERFHWRLSVSLIRITGHGKSDGGLTEGVGSLVPKPEPFAVTGTENGLLFRYSGVRGDS